MSEEKAAKKRGGHALLAIAIREKLSERGWTLRQAARETGIPFYSISLMSHGESIPVDRVMKFALLTAEKNRRFETMLSWLRMADEGDLANLISNAVTHREPAENPPLFPIIDFSHLRSAEAREIATTAYNVALKIEASIDRGENE